jgi:hypothetical protein
MTYRQFLVWVKKNAGLLENLRSGQAALAVDNLLASGQIEFKTPIERRVFQLAHIACVGPVNGQCRMLGSNTLTTRADAVKELEQMSEEGQYIRRYKLAALSRLVGSPEIKGIVSGMEMLVE